LAGCHWPINSEKILQGNAAGQRVPGRICLYLARGILAGALAVFAALVLLVVFPAATFGGLLSAKRAGVSVTHLVMGL
jgi:hypothetical protein